jgi:hypothetical protein
LKGKVPPLDFLPIGAAGLPSNDCIKPLFYRAPSTN